MRSNKELWEGEEIRTGWTKTKISGGDRGGRIGAGKEKRQI